MFNLELIHDKIELFEAYDAKTLEKKMDQQIENNKALLLEVSSVTHNVVYSPIAEKMLYTAIVHFKAKQQK